MNKRVIVGETEKAFPLLGRGYSDACFFQYIRRSVIVSSRPSSRETREHMPRFPSLRSIPAQAVGLKKYRDGRPPVSKISDKEDSTATLGNSEELSVQDSVGKMIPAFSQRLGKVTEVDPAVRGQASWNVFPKNPARCNFTSQADKVEGQSTALSRKSGSLSGDREVLAGSPPDQKVNCSTVFSPVDFCHVTEIGHVWVVMRKHGTRKPFDL